MSDAIEIQGLTKVFGHARALDGVDLKVPEGSVFGFLGPNGAGKTTTLRVLTGLAEPTSGHARIFGHDAQRAPDAVRALIGFLPDVPGFYDWMTAEQFMRFAGSLFGLPRSVLDERVVALLDLAGLGGERARIGGFSRGMKQRLGMAQALVNAPRLLLLDEPTSALDPIGRKAILDMLGHLQGRTTVFFSTHILADVERVCDSVAVLDRGRIVVQGSMADLKRRFSRHQLVVDVDGAADPLVTRLRQESWALAVDCLDGTGPESGHRVVLRVSDRAAAQRVIPAAVAQLGLGLVRFAQEDPSLEDVFVELVGSPDGREVRS